jgi:hypothetical protein
VGPHLLSTTRHLPGDSDVSDKPSDPLLYFQPETDRTEGGEPGRSNDAGDEFIHVHAGAEDIPLTPPPASAFPLKPQPWRDLSVALSRAARALVARWGTFGAGVSAGIVISALVSGLNGQTSRFGVAAGQEVPGVDAEATQQATAKDIELHPVRGGESLPAAVNPRPYVHRGRLVVTSRPRGAQVFINNRLAGRTPLDMRALPIGSRAIRLKLEGYDPWSRGVSVVANESTTVVAQLSRNKPHN